MEVFDAIYWMIAFGLFVLLSSLVQNGIFIITRGETHQRPDGKAQDVNDMIAYWFYKLVMAEAYPPQKVYYRGEHLRQLVRRIEKSLPVTGHSEISVHCVEYVQHIVQIAAMYSHVNIKEWLDSEGVVAEVSQECDDKSCKTRVQFYTEQKRYVLGKYLRKPLVECLKCFPSIWGSLLYWPAVIWWFSGFSAWQLVVWIPYLLACSYVNTLLFYRAK